MKVKVKEQDMLKDTKDLSQHFCNTNTLKVDNVLRNNKSYNYQAEHSYNCFGEGMGLSTKLVKFIKSMEPGFCASFSEHV